MQFWDCPQFMDEQRDGSARVRGAPGMVTESVLESADIGTSAAARPGGAIISMLRSLGATDSRGDYDSP